MIEPNKHIKVLGGLFEIILYWKKQLKTELFKIDIGL